MSNATFPETLRLRRVARSNRFGGALWPGSADTLRRPFRVEGAVGLVSASLLVGEVSTSAMVSRTLRRALSSLGLSASCSFAPGCLSGVRRELRRVDTGSGSSATSADEERFGVLSTLLLARLEGVSTLLGPGTGDDSRAATAEDEEWRRCLFFGASAFSGLGVFAFPGLLRGDPCAGLGVRAVRPGGLSVADLFCLVSLALVLGTTFSGVFPIWPSVLASARPRVRKDIFNGVEASNVFSWRL